MISMGVTYKGYTEPPQGKSAFSTNAKKAFVEKASKL